MRRRPDDAAPPAALLVVEGFLSDGPVPFYPGRDRDDPVVVAAVGDLRHRLARWRATRAAWARVHGWPGGDEVRVAEEEKLAGEFGADWDPTLI
jgi:hypothetical protein